MGFWIDIAFDGVFLGYPFVVTTGLVGYEWNGVAIILTYIDGEVLYSSTQRRMSGIMRQLTKKQQSKKFPTQYSLKPRRDYIPT